MISFVLAKKTKVIRYLIALIAFYFARTGQRKIIVLSPNSLGSVANFYEKFFIFCTQKLRY